jgi:hypothetical protein
VEAYSSDFSDRNPLAATQSTMATQRQKQGKEEEYSNEFMPDFEHEYAN